MENKCKIEIKSIDFTTHTGTHKVGVYCNFTSCYGNNIHFEFDASKNAGHYSMKSFGDTLVRMGEEVKNYAKKFNEPK